MKKKAFTVPFFTPIIAIILAIVMLLIGLAYNAWVDDKVSELEENIQIEEAQQ